MDARLLRLFQYTETRSVRSDRLLEIHGRPGRLHQKLKRTLYIRFLYYLPIRAPIKRGLFLPNDGTKVSKTGIAFRELKEAFGCYAHDNLRVNQTPSWPSVYYAARAIVRLPRALCILVWLRTMHRRLTPYQRCLIIGLDATRRYLRWHPGINVLIISDLSERLAVLSLAAELEGRRGVWWQDDLHHTSPPLFKMEYGCFLNERAMQSSLDSRRISCAFQRPLSQAKPIRRLKSSPIVGVAVNGIFRFSELELKILQDIKNQLCCKTLHLRLHPRSKLLANESPKPWIHIADRDEALESFAERIDLAVVGNSASQLRLIILGVPVIHIGGLDNLGYDVYQYVAAGILPGTPSTHDLSLQKIQEFYAGSDINALLAKQIGFSQGKKPKDLGALRNKLVRI